MARKRGNPEFGTKYRTPRKEEIPFDAQIKIDIHSQTKSKVVKLAREKNCSVPDLVREALYRYLGSDDQATA